MTSLATQLLQNASLNSALLVDRSRRKPRESYLFTGKEADNYDLDTLFALGVNGLIQLSSLDSSLRAFEDDLFSDQARSTDRTLLSTEANAKLNKTIGNFLPLLGQFLLEPPTNKVLEWLVRRFRIHEFNVEEVLALFLPYHETLHFAKMLSILHIKPNSTWSFLLPFKSAAQSVPRMPLVTEMLKNTDVARFTSSLLPSSLKHNYVHQTLVVFNAACLDGFLSKSKSLDEGTIAYLLPAILQPLQKVDHDFAQESILSSYILLARFSQKARISATALKSIISKMTDAAEHVSARQFLTTVIAVLSPQDELECFSRKTSKRILEIPFVVKASRDAASLVGFEKLMIPLLTGLSGNLNDNVVQKLLSSLLTYKGTPKALLKHISLLVLQRVASSDTPPENLRDLLYSIYQRHPAILQLSSAELIDSDEAIKPTVQQILISLSLEAQAPAKDINNRTQDVIVASTVAESNVRVIAVKEMIEKLSVLDSLAQSEQESIQSALILRVQDTETEVLEALYERPDVIAPLLLRNASTYIDALVSSLRSSASKPKRNILKLHLSFLAKYFNTKADNDVIARVFHSIFFPFLLFFKARQRIAEMVWDIIAEDMPDADPSAYELLHGCAVIVQDARGKSEDSVQTMSEINSSLASKMARNILMSNNYAVHLETFVTKLQVDDPHVQAFAYLIIHALIKQLSGEHQIDAAHKVLDVLGRDVSVNLVNVTLDSNKALESLDGVELARHTVVKPSSSSTLSWLQLAIVSIISSITPPNIALDWTADLDFTPMDIRGRHYVELMRTVYFIINATPLSSSLVTALLHAFFGRLGHHSLAFLAGIWCGVHKVAKDQDQLRVVALQHASAYLQARIEENIGMDYQTILPLLLVALSSPSVLLRQEALRCLSQLQALTEHPFNTVYKFDAVYGANEGQLQYLEQKDLKKYLTSLGEEGDHLLHDHLFVRMFHERHLRRNKSDKKRENEYRIRVLCYLLSHVRSLSLPTAQIALLKVLEGISNKVKARMLSPITATFVDKQVYTDAEEELVGLCIATFDSTVASDLNEPQSTLWSLYEATVRRYFSSGEPFQLRAVLSSSLEELFPRLSQERKVSLSELILEIGALDFEMYGPSKNLLTNILDDVPLIIHLLVILQPPSNDPGQRSSKRLKIAEVDDSMRRLILLIEVLGIKALPGSLDLISQLLDMISSIARAVSPAQADVNYIEQLLMSAVENAAEKMTGKPKPAPSVIRLDTLVELIRVSDNPQTFHQALLLISRLSPLAPESVLHNIMPVFTFMGSNIFHRDDAYSFKVVQRTMESIVPFMITSLKKSHAEKLDLYIASRDFLRIFTDAANHIPRHRRNQFFFHLVDVLGPADFLAPVIMLLVAKSANRVVRQTHEEAQATLALPIAILQHFSPSLQIIALTEMLYESQRLVARIIDPNTIQSTVLGDSTNETKGAKALISFVGIFSVSSSPTPGCLVHASSEELSAFTLMLIALATFKDTPTGNIDVDDIREAAYTSLRHALTAMPAATFVASVVTMLESQDSDVQSGALDLLGERLPMIADDVRQTVTDMVKKIIDCILSLITSQTDVPVIDPAFRALRSIGLSLQVGEEATISNTVPIILAIIKKDAVIAPVALASLVPLPTKLGPRFIPYLRDTVSICVYKMVAEQDAQTLLQNLLVAIPTFWGITEVIEVISTFTKSPSPPSVAMLGLIRAITKRIPPKVLLSSLLQMWSTYQGAMDKTMKANIGTYSDVITRALRSAPQPLVLELLRPLVKLFLDALEVVAAETNRTTENNVISAFKQFAMKLNDTTFKPIYRRIYDWAYATDNVDIRKRVIFCHLYASLLDSFKSLMAPYMSFLQQPFITDLEAFNKTALQDKEYWTCILDVTTKSLRVDDGAYWRDDKLRQISKPLIMQVPLSIDLCVIEQRQMLQDCLDALVDNTMDDTLLKSTNLDILMHTRSEDPRVRVFAFGCAEVLWRMHGGKLRGFVAETATFIAEGIEDENELVVKESLKLKNSVESVAGSIDGL